jgi:hypothetical protein
VEQNSPRLSPSLSQLTDGKIAYDSFAAFVDARGPEAARAQAEAFLRFKTKDSPLQPLFDAYGNALRMRDSSPINLPWRWPACLTYEIIRRAGRTEPWSTASVADLPVPFWQAVGVHLFTRDGYAIAAVRSNWTKNAVGKALSTAAGAFETRDGTPKTGAGRELKEETGLVLDRLGGRIIELPPDTDRGVNLYPENMSPDAGEVDIRQAACPQIGRTIILQSSRTLKELVRDIRLEKEALGVVAIPVAAIERIMRNPSVRAEAIFYPTQWMPGNATGFSTAPSLAGRRDAVMALRRELRNANNAHLLVPVRNKNALRPYASFGLKPPHEIWLTAYDMRDGDYQKSLCLWFDAAVALGLIRNSAHVLTRQVKRSQPHLLAEHIAFKPHP